MRGHRLRLSHRPDQPLGDVVYLHRGEAQPRETRNHADRSHEPLEVVPGAPIPIAAQVDPGEHDLTVTLAHAASDLAEHRLRGPTTRGSAHLRDDTEPAR